MNYITRTGETLESIAIKFYGNGARYIDIYNGNSYLFGRYENGIGSKDILLAGENLHIPIDSISKISDILKDITVIINGRELPYYEGITLIISLDAICNTFAFSVPNEISLDKELYNALSPFSEARVQIFYNQVQSILVHKSFTDLYIIFKF